VVTKEGYNTLHIAVILVKKCLSKMLVEKTKAPFGCADKPVEKHC
jgi:hypothetical protein